MSWIDPSIHHMSANCHQLSRSQLHVPSLLQPAHNKTNKHNYYIYDLVAGPTLLQPAHNNLNTYYCYYELDRSFHSSHVCKLSPTVTIATPRPVAFAACTTTLLLL